MSRNDDQRVADILDAANELANITAVGSDTFASSPLHIRAAERLLEIIGEASNTLSDEFKNRHSDIACRRSPPFYGFCSLITTTVSTSTRSGKSQPAQSPSSPSDSTNPDNNASHPRHGSSPNPPPDRRRPILGHLSAVAIERSIRAALQWPGAVVRCGYAPSIERHRPTHGERPRRAKRLRKVWRFASVDGTVGSPDPAASPLAQRLFARVRCPADDATNSTGRLSTARAGSHIPIGQGRHEQRDISLDKY